MKDLALLIVAMTTFPELVDKLEEALAEHKKNPDNLEAKQKLAANCVLFATKEASERAVKEGKNDEFAEAGKMGEMFNNARKEAEEEEKSPKITGFGGPAAQA